MRRPDAKAALDAAADAYAYVGFENLYRGARDEIRSRLVEYLPLFVGASDVLDVGCGRGEFLDLLRERDVRASGVDVNAEMVGGVPTRAASRRAPATP